MAFLCEHEMIASRRTVFAAIGRSAVQASAVGTQSRSFATLRSGFGSRPAEKSRWGQTEATFQSVLDRFAKVSSLVHTQCIDGGGLLSTNKGIVTIEFEEGTFLLCL